MIFAAVIGRAQTVPLDLNFQLLTGLEYKPLANPTVRLVLGEGQDWQSPGAGSSFVTDAEGKAQLTTNVIIDKRWQWVNVGITPISWPIRTDHLQIVAELVTVVPADAGGQDIPVHILYKMDVSLRGHGVCWTYGFTSMYVADAAGRFTVGVPSTGLPIANSGGMVLFGEGYQPWDYGLDPADQPNGHWKLKLAFKRNPPPVRR